MKSSFSLRIKIFAFCILIFSFVLIGKLFLVQIVHSESYIKEADRQYITPASNILERGDIYFSRKDGQLVFAATQTLGYKLTINPSQITNEEEVYQKISNIIEINRDDFLLKASKKNDPYEEIANHLSKDKADEINKLNIAGLKIFQEKWRFYPGGNLASHALGFLGYKGDELGGRYGLERFYNDTLTRDKDNPYVNFFAEVFSNINKTLFENKTKKGDLITTIEPNVQSYLEKELEIVKEKYNVDSIGGIIMDPKTGSIYAMALKPDFDLNNFSETKSVSIFSNGVVENVLEFGSVVKPLVMAGAIDAKVLKADTKYNDKGSVIVEKKEIFNFDKKARGDGITMQEVLSQSLNTGMVFVYQKLGKEKMRDYMYSFGIKDKTGIDLPNETNSLISNLNSPRELEYANAAFGQGIALTPIQMIRALASLSNGGVLVTPHFVQKIKYENGKEVDINYETKATKITKETSQEISRMLVTIMDKSLNQGKSKMEHYSVAVKTGTAQVANNKDGGYYKDRHTHSFFGYFPAYDPKFIVFLYAINPKDVAYASQTWTNPFLSISKFLLNYYEVPPDR